MITSAQAEALLTLAESLEACEDQGITLRVVGVNDTGHLLVHLPNRGFECPVDRYGHISAFLLRYEISVYAPKPTGS